MDFQLAELHQLAVSGVLFEGLSECKLCKVQAIAVSTQCRPFPEMQTFCRIGTLFVIRSYFYFAMNGKIKTKFRHNDVLEVYYR